MSTQCIEDRRRQDAGPLVQEDDGVFGRVLAKQLLKSLKRQTRVDCVCYARGLAVLSNVDQSQPRLSASARAILCQALGGVASDIDDVVSAAKQSFCAEPRDRSPAAWLGPKIVENNDPHLLFTLLTSRDRPLRKPP
jgi:hypothetical protein